VSGSPIKNKDTRAKSIVRGKNKNNINIIVSTVMPGRDGTGPLGTGPCEKGKRACRKELAGEEKNGKGRRLKKPGHWK
jgi:hypothetical protein